MTFISLSAIAYVVVPSNGWFAVKWYDSSSKTWKQVTRFKAEFKAYARLRELCKV